MSKKTLSDLKPRPLEAVLSNGTILKLRRASMADVEWTETFFLGKKVHPIRRSCIIAYRLLINKADFKAVEIEDYDDNGEPFKIKKTASDLIMEQIITAEDFKQISIAINNSFDIPNEVNEKIEAIANGIETEKKK